MANEIFKIDEKTYRIEDNFVRSFLLLGDEKALLIDSGCTNPDARKAAETITDLPIVLYNTHGDGDHTAGTGAFTEIHISEADFVNCGVKDRFPDVKCIDIEDGEKIDLGNRIIEVVAIPGHTYGSVAFLDAERKFLIPGDSVQSGHVFLFGKHRNPSVFKAGLEKLVQMEEKFDKLYPSHDAPELPGNYIEVVLHAWESVERGEVEATIEDMHGTEVLSYDALGCGFYCDKKLK